MIRLDPTWYMYGMTGIQQQYSNNAWLYATQDALGSVWGVADVTMAVLESRYHEPHGEPWGMTGTPQADFDFMDQPVDKEVRSICGHATVT